MTVELEALLEELARRHARGEPLDVAGLLAQAGERADELAPLIEAFLARAPRGAPSDEAKAFVRSLDDPPLLRARVARRLRVDDVVDAIVAACGLPPEARAKVRRYYQQLEGGILDPVPVAASVWDAITAMLGRSRAALTAPPADLLVHETIAYLRAEQPLEQTELPGLAAPAAEPDAPDEVDALFLGEPQ
jgi:hypothetical protein